MIATPGMQQQKRSTATASRSMPARVSSATATRARETSVTPAISAIERTLNTLRSPLDFADWKSWQSDAAWEPLRCARP